MKEFKKDKLTVKVMATRTEMGQVAAQDIHDRILALLAEKDEINMIFAAAPSQNDVLKSLTEYTDIPWNRINACHMDEYIGLDKSAPQGFGNFLKAHIFDLVPFKSVNLIDCSATDPEAESARYTEILKKYPTDIVVMGIGENGHIAFNDPPVADFNDPKLVKLVPLDPVCRQQQVNDGCFATLDDVPTHALSLTIPALTRAGHLFCTVPAATKRAAVTKTVNDPVSTECPATIMRNHPDATLFCDPESGADLLK